MLRNLKVLQNTLLKPTTLTPYLGQTIFICYNITFYLNQVHIHGNTVGSSVCLHNLSSKLSKATSKYFSHVLFRFESIKHKY